MGGGRKAVGGKRIEDTHDARRSGGDKLKGTEHALAMPSARMKEEEEEEE